MDIDLPKYDEVDGVKLKAKQIELTIDEPKESREPKRLKLYHMMSPAQKLQVWLMSGLTTVTIVAQLVSILGQAAVFMELRGNHTNYK